MDIERGVEIKTGGTDNRFKYNWLLPLGIDLVKGTGDQAVIEDTLDNRMNVVYKALRRCNTASTGPFADYFFSHRYEERDGKKVIVIQRVEGQEEG